jgi:hypothetical protein
MKCKVIIEYGQAAVQCPNERVCLDCISLDKNVFLYLLNPLLHIAVSFVWSKRFIGSTNLSFAQ